MINILRSIFLIFAFIFFAGLFENFIALRMSGRSTSSIISKTSRIIAELFLKSNASEILILTAYVALAVLVSGSFIIDLKCMDVLFYLLALNFLYGYIVYSRAKLIQARRFNTSMLLFIMNGFVFSISILSMLHVNGLEYMSGVVFIQQNGLNSWNVIRNPAIFSLSFLSLFAFAGFPPFGGISEQNDANLAYEKNNTRSILWILARIFRYSLYAFFINLYFGGASSILFMLLKLLAIHTLFSLVSTIFPKMGTKENTLFNSLMLILLAVVVVLQGGKFN